MTSVQVEPDDLTQEQRYLVTHSTPVASPPRRASGYGGIGLSQARMEAGGWVSVFIFVEL
jgi:hypothetical protein